MKRSLSLCLVLLLGSPWLLGCGGASDVHAEVQATDFVNHGSPAPVARHRGVVATQTPDGRAVILAWLSGRMDAALLKIDVDSGETEQFDVGDRARGRAFLLTDAGQFYAYGDSKLLVYDLHENELSIVNGPGQFGDSIAEADDGTIYIALRPDATLLAYDPDTGTLHDHGQMAEAPHMQWPRNLAVDDQGWVYAGYTRNIVTALNPATGERRIVADEQEEGSGLAPVFRGTDGAVYGRACRNGLGHVEDREEPWQRFRGGEGEALEGEPPVERAPIIGGSQGYGGSHADVHRHFPDGRYLREINIRSLEPYAEIAPSEEAEQTERIAFSYEAGGPYIFSVTAGPDGRIHGSTGHPLYVYRFDPETQAFESDRLAGGHLNAMTTQGGYMFGAMYSSGQLHKYDPEEAWDPEGGNPRVVASGDSRHAMVTRPYTIKAHPDGRHVIMGGYYDRSGFAGGGLVIYDMEEDESIRLSKYDLRVGHNPRALAVLPDGNLLVGTTTSMRNQIERKAHEGKLLILDWDTKEVVHELVPTSGGENIRELRAGPDGERIYGIAGSDVFFVFDPSTREVVEEQRLEGYGSAAGAQAPRMMKLARDGMFYALFDEHIVQINPATYEHRSVGEPPVPVTTGIEILDGRIYFTHESHLWSAHLKGE